MWNSISDSMEILISKHSYTFILIGVDMNQVQFFIHSANPKSRHMLSVRPHFSKQNKLQAKTMVATGETVGLAEWIIDDTYLVILTFDYWRMEATQDQLWCCVATKFCLEHFPHNIGWVLNNIPIKTLLFKSFVNAWMWD